MKLLNGKKALITGARKGIGRGIAYKLAEQGADIGINDYIDDEETRKTASLVESLGRKCCRPVLWEPPGRCLQFQFLLPTGGKNCR